MSSREQILGRIRQALGRSGPPAQAVQDEARAYMEGHATGPRPPADWDRLERFMERAKAMACTVERVGTLEQVPGAVARYLRDAGLPASAVVWPEVADWGWDAAGINVEPRRARGEDLVGITGAFCGIAETGTLALLSGAGTPGSVSLVPENHVAVVSAKRIVDSVEDALGLVRAERGGPPRALNLVSGPSRTADIEQTVTLGAHGPYRVHVIVVD
ncbi:MAG TPA: lactate utilization protein C [Pelomicrobium sp.]|nr:lactate utilization protein C [Pelomicrobium sp.]